MLRRIGRRGELERARELETFGRAAAVTSARALEQFWRPLRKPTRRQALEQLLEVDRRFVRALPADVRRLLRETPALRHLLDSELVRFEAFVRALRKLLDRARAQGWRPDRWAQAVLALARLWSRGGYAVTFLETGLVVPFFDRGEEFVLEDDEVSRVYPYLEQLTRVDQDRAEGEVRVRENHLALHGFVAETHWPGWVAEVMPPLGWRCRCRLRRVSFIEAREKGWSGEFPLGVGPLERFRALGGADDGFPRDFFVEGARAA